jgi:hypothetical protein
MIAMQGSRTRAGRGGARTGGPGAAGARRAVPPPPSALARAGTAAAPARRLPAPPRPHAPDGTPGTAAPPGAKQQRAGYPWIDGTFPGLEMVHAEPPVYIVHGLLPAPDCAALVAAACGGALDGLEYENAGERGGGTWGAGRSGRLGAC